MIGLAKVFIGFCGVLVAAAFFCKRQLGSGFPNHYDALECGDRQRRPT